MESPLISVGSPLDARQQGVIARVSAAEHAAILTLPSDDPLDPKRLARTEATWPELIAQPEMVRRTWAANEKTLVAAAEAIRERRIERVYLVGAGDSYAVMISARLALQDALGVPVEAVQSLEFAYYLGPVLTARTLVVALSSSGETTRTVEAALVAQHAGALTLALTNTAGSTLDVESEQTLRIEATRVGWPTQSSTAALALLLKLAGMLGGEQPDHLPDLMAEVIGGLSHPIAAIAEREAGSRMFLFSAGGPSFGAALAGAAKYKECTPDHALAIQVEEYHHYNSQKAGEPLLLLAPSGWAVPRAVDTRGEALRFGGRAYVVTSAGETAFGDDVLRLPAVPEALSPLLTFLPAQLMGYHAAMAKFRAAQR
ncbi:SIS domain-containing protein [Actinoplanes sp. NPDC026619]|uniref:SIS domain-containing protein n=1 Tax=Actinoplanes sp. NPDC026619 TaxID=3155798 RepID=UPI0033DA2352